MPDAKREEETVAAIARARYKGWPARMIGKAAPGWAQVLLVVLRTHPPGRDAVGAALLDEATLSGALEHAGLPDGADADAVAMRLLAAVAGEQVP
jgi:hypothetical protein